MSVTTLPSPPAPAIPLTPLPGCSPSEMDGLIECYNNVNNATGFISAILIDLINNDPAVAQAMIGAIQKNGSNIPIVGVTNGAPAITPQVGQYVQLTGTLDYTSTVTAAMLSLGVLPAGDWLCWLWATFTANISGAQYWLDPLPPGFAATPFASNYSVIWPSNAVLSTMPVEALTSADSLIVANTSVAATSGQSGTMTVYFAAKRTR